MTPSIASIIRNKRVQFLPVQWRANLKLNVEEAKARESEGLDNDFTLAGRHQCASIIRHVAEHFSDITMKNNVPLIRELMNNVLIDIPYFMRCI